MKSTSELSARALDVARDLATSGYGADVRVLAESSSEGWHGTLLRYLFEQQVSLWSVFSRIDVISDSTGRVLGFVDHEAYRRADDTSALSDDDVRAIVADDEFLPPRSRIVHRTSYASPEGGRLEAVTVEGRTPAGLQRWLIEINIARRLVASVRPLDGADGIAQS
jgi:hypothetical protein